jgi:acyl-CoA reductase-like NAD-dependent aldehyde dehydrogenase
VAEDWVTACCRAKGVAPESPAAGEEWIGLGISYRQAHMLRRSLKDLAGGDVPEIPGPVSRDVSGCVTAGVMPRACCDRLVFGGLEAHVELAPEVDHREAVHDRARLYRRPPGTGRVAAVLGAGNQACLTTGDVLHKLFVERCAVAFKPNPVLAELGPLMEEAFADVVQAGALAVVYGGSEVGRRLVQHERVDEVHMTGGRATCEAVQRGLRESGKADRPVTAELGNVTPLVIVPGDWSDRDLRRQADLVAAALVHNAGYNCLTPHLLVTHAGWSRRDAFLDALREVLGRVPTRPAWYPRADEQWTEAVEAHPEAERIGRRTDRRLPWTLVPGVQLSGAEPLVAREHFCPVLAEAPVQAPSRTHFVRQAAERLNEHAWGDLTATVVLDDESAGRADVVDAVERAVQELRYGTVGINSWGAMAYATGVIPWGAWDGDGREGQSGRGFVNNALMLEGVRKTVVRAPFRQRLKPPEHMRSADRLGRALARFQRRPGAVTFCRLIAAGVRHS